ncbi:MAG: dipeptidyl carboxypeptidase II [Verrucomicrobia bacterium 13_2_20CM_55_10]|nr:MAG: dipeptidyl carboxypeptidase II [Verrucomicrobia bacterium 13_2_20CM_55_10]
MTHIVVISVTAQTPPVQNSNVEGNPLLTESSLPYHVPPFDRIKDEHFAPAMEKGMREELKEVEVVANNSEKPTFENTIVALERTGRLLDRAERTFDNLNACNTNPTLQKIETEMAPKLAAHRDAIHLNSKLFARVQELYDNRDKLGLDPESAYLLERYYKDFVRAGAKLSDPDKEKLKKINSELATLQTQFEQNVLKEKNASSIVVDRKEDLAGLSDNQMASLINAAKAEHKEGKFVIQLQNTTGQPLLGSLQNRPLHERIMQTSLGRNSKGGEFDTRNIVIRTAQLRAEKAKLLGYSNWAAYQLEDQTAHNVPTVNKLLADLAPPAVANAKREAADMQKIVEEEKGGFQVASWDWDFYSEKVRKARYAFDESELRPYYELNHVIIDGVFFAAGKLYGLTFKERHDIPVYQPDVRVFEVYDRDGKPLALFLGDYYARPSKRGGAWMNAYVQQNDLFATKPVVANHLNIPKPPPGEPTLLTHDEVRTAFHEFGHALHGMFSKVKFPRFSGTSVPRDFVEYPSQVNEMWATWPEVLKNYAKHYKTGEPIPQALLDKVIAAQKFNQGFKTTEYLSASLLDQAWHQLNPSEVPKDAVAFEAEALHKAGVDFPPVPPRYRSFYFSHAFAGGYSAGYYSYLWSEVLDADTVEWFKEHGGLKRENGDRLRAMLLSRGGSADALGLFKNFVGRDPYIEPLLKRRGLDRTPGADDTKVESQPPVRSALWDTLSPMTSNELPVEMLPQFCSVIACERTT